MMRFQGILEVRLVCRQVGKADFPLYVAIGRLYSPPASLEGLPLESEKWFAVRVKLCDMDDADESDIADDSESEGFEIVGKTALEALELAIVFIKSFLREHLSSGRLFELDGRPFELRTITGQSDS